MQKEYDMLSRVAITVKRWREMERTKRELQRLSDRELWDIGISRCDIPRVVRVSYRKEQA